MGQRILRTIDKQYLLKVLHQTTLISKYRVNIFWGILNHARKDCQVMSSSREHICVLTIYVVTTLFHPTLKRFEQSGNTTGILRIQFAEAAITLPNSHVSAKTYFWSKRAFIPAF